MTSVLEHPAEPRRSEELPMSVRRHAGDWLAQFLWAIENGIEETVDLYLPPARINARPRGTFDAATGLFDPDLILWQPRVDAPSLPAYVCYVPPEPRLGFGGKRVTLYPEGVAGLRTRLAERCLLDVWDEYSAGGCYQIYSYHRASGGMQLTPKARRTPGIGRAAETLAEAFAAQLLGARVRR